MLGEINKGARLRKPNLSLAKPNRSKVGKLKNIYDVTLSTKLYGLHELSFSVPYKIFDRNMQLVKNPLVNKIRERYLVRLEFGTTKEWFIITSIKDVSSNRNDYKQVNAFWLPYELGSRLIRRYEATSKTAYELLADVLSSTDWTIGQIDPIFEGKYRSLKLTSTTVLDAINEIAKTFKAHVSWDSNNKTVSLLDPEKIGSYKGLTISYGKYLRSLDKESLTDEMVTRLYAYGRDDLSIRRVNPTGAPYIEDFSFFMYPFERDENKNVIRSSYWMTDELCHALLDYQELIESKTGEFDSLLTQKETLQEQKTIKETELFDLETELALIKDRLDIQRSEEVNTLTIHDFIYNGSKETRTASLEDTVKKYAAMIYVSNTTNLTIMHDEEIKNVPSGQWTLLGKLSGVKSTKFEITGPAENVQVKIYVVEITDEEFESSDNEEEIIEKYNDHHKQMQIDAKQAEIDVINNQINEVDGKIQDLRNEISIENNFTPELIKERNQYIIEKEFYDNNYVNDYELYEDVKKKFKEFREPKTIIDIDIVNFLEVVEAQRDWDKLFLGDDIRIKHELLDLEYKAKIIGIDYDFDKGDIKLTIANAQNIARNYHEYFNKIIGKTISTSTTLDMEQFKWDKIDKYEDDINAILNEALDATKRYIVAGTDQSVNIGDRGIIIKKSTDPLNYLVANNAVLAITNDGGETWKHAITPKGIIGDRIIGRLFVGSNLTIEHENGLFQVNKDGVIIDGSALRFTSGQKSVVYNPDLIIKEEPIDYYSSNNTLSSIPANPIVADDGTAIGHTINDDGTSNISFEWDFPDSGTGINIDGFIVYMYVSSNSAPYSFGTDTANEYQFIVRDTKRSIILYNVPTDHYFTFGVQAYRKVDSSVDINEILTSNIITSTVSTDNPYKTDPSKAFSGDIRGTISGNDFNTIENRAVNSIQQGAMYNGVQIDTNSGLVITRGDNLIRTIANATDGFKIQANENGNWVNRFYADTSGNIHAEKLILKGSNGGILLDANSNTLDFSKFTTLAGTIKADNIEAQSITLDKLDPLAKDMLNNWTKTEDISKGWSVISGSGDYYLTTSELKNNTPAAVLSTNTSITLASDFIEIDPNKSYKINVSLYTTDEQGTRYFGFYAYDANKTLISVTEWDVTSKTWGTETTSPFFWSQAGPIKDEQGNYIYHDIEAYVLSSNIKDEAVPVGRGAHKHFRLPFNAKYIRVVIMNNDNLTNSSVEIWSPSMNEADVGIFTFDMAKGGTLSLGGVNNQNGVLYLLDEFNELAVQLDATIKGFDRLYVANFESPTVLSRNIGLGDKYVDVVNGDDGANGDGTPEKPFKTVNRALESLPKYLDEDVKIHVKGTGTWYEDIRIEGFSGPAQLFVECIDNNFESNIWNTKLRGSIRIYRNTARIYIQRFHIEYTGNNGNRVVDIDGNCAVNFQRSRIYGKSDNTTNYAIYIKQQAGVQLYELELYRCKEALIFAQYGSVVGVNNIYGNSCPVGIKADRSYVSGQYPVPNCSTVAEAIWGAIINIEGKDDPANKKNGYNDRNPTGAATPEVTKTFTVTSSGSWRDAYGGWRTDNNYVYQGEWNEYGHHKGLWFFGSALSNELQGKNIKRMRIYCTRRNEGGNAGDVYVEFRYHNYTSRPSGEPSLGSEYISVPFKRGQSKWVELPSSFFNNFESGSAKGIGIYTSSTSNSKYAIFSGSAKIEVTYQ